MAIIPSRNEKQRLCIFGGGGGGGGADKVHYDNGRCASGEWVKALCNDFNTKFT